MAIGITTVQGGAIVTGLPRRRSPSDRVAYYTTSDLVASLKSSSSDDVRATATHTQFNLAALGTIYNTMQYARTMPSSGANPGDAIYISTRDGADVESVVDQDDIVTGLLGEGDHLGVVGPLTGLAAAGAGSGQLSLSAEPLESELPIVRYCIEYDTPNEAQWIARDPIGAPGGQIHQRDRDPVDGKAAVDQSNTISIRTSSDYDPGLSVGSVDFRRVQLYRSRAVLTVSERLPADLESRLSLYVGVRYSTSKTASFSAATYNARFRAYTFLGSGWPWGVGNTQATTRIFADAVAGDGADGDVWVRDGSKSWQRSGPNWSVVHDLSGGPNVIRVVRERPRGSLGSDGDYAYASGGADGVEVWQRDTRSVHVVLMAPGWPYVVEDLTDGHAYTFTAAVLNLAGLGPSATVDGTPSATPDAPPQRTAQLATSNDRVSATVDPVDDADVDWDYRGRETDEDGNTEGYQRVVTGSRSVTAEISGLSPGGEARLRAVTRRNPETAGPESVIQVGKSVDGAYVPPGHWDRPLPEWQSYYRILQQLIGYADGRKLYRYHHPVLEQRQVAPEFREAGPWTAGGSYSGDAPRDVVSHSVSATSGALTAQVPRKFVCHTSHSGATAETEPGVGENWRDYWHAFGEYLRFILAGVDPDAADDVEPDEASDEAVPAEDAQYLLQLHDVVGPLDGTGGTLGVGESGEFAFVYRGADGPRRLVDWVLVTSRTTTVVMSLIDRNGFDASAFHRGIQRGKLMQFTWPTRWVAFRIQSARISDDGRKSVVEALPVSASTTDAAEPPVADGLVDVRFDFGPPVVTTPEASPVPVAPASLVVTHKLEPPPNGATRSQINDYRIAGDYLELDVGAPVSGDTPFTYEIKLVVPRGRGFPHRIWTFGGPEQAGRRWWDGDPSPDSPTWPNIGAAGTAASRSIGVDAAGRICVPRVFLGAPGAAATLDVNAAVVYVEVRAGNPDGQYGPFLRRTAIADGIP